MLHMYHFDLEDKSTGWTKRVCGRRPPPAHARLHLWTGGNGEVKKEKEEEEEKQE